MLFLFLGLGILYNSNTQVLETAPVVNSENNTKTNASQTNSDREQINVNKTNALTEADNNSSKSKITSKTTPQITNTTESNQTITETKPLLNKTNITSEKKSIHLVSTEANTINQNNSNVTNTIKNSENKSTLAETSNENKYSEITTNSSQEKVTITSENKSALTETTNKTDLNTIQKNIEILKEQSKDSNLTEAENETEAFENPIKEDSLQNSETIEEAIANAENKLEPEEIAEKWSVNTNIAPVYYNTLGQGSHIHSQFNENKKDGETNTSYGLSVGYALNTKLKIRSGINKLNLSYDTADVIVYENVSNTPSKDLMRNINLAPNNQGQTLSALSADNLIVQQIAPGQSPVPNLNAALSQRISYLEVPLELEYEALNKQRVGLNLIGGFSTFILNDNQVVTEVEGYKTKIGEANNINDVSFSANLGFGIDYKFSKTFQFNLEPTFKYQIKAYENTSGDFRPYIIGVYTGFSYKF
jgi:hypothetical protein